VNVVGTLNILQAVNQVGTESHLPSSHAAMNLSSVMARQKRIGELLVRSLGRPGDLRGRAAGKRHQTVAAAASARSGGRSRRAGRYQSRTGGRALLSDRDEVASLIIQVALVAEPGASTFWTSARR
jgi:hypothetical protein